MSIWWVGLFMEYILSQVVCIMFGFLESTEVF